MFTAQHCPEATVRQLYGEALVLAASSGSSEVVQDLLQGNFEYNLGSLTETLDAICMKGNKQLLQLFLRFDQKKMFKNENYSRGLNEAVKENNCQIILYWLEEHTNHDELVVDPQAVLIACEKGFVNFLPQLLERVRPIDSWTEFIGQCLQMASKNGAQGCCRILDREGC